MAKFLITPTVVSEDILSVRLGGNTVGTRFTDADVGKPVKLVAESQYGLCVAGDAIEGVVNSVETSTYDGFVVGGIVEEGYSNAVANGLQATPGVGVLAINDYVVASAPAAVQVASATPLQVLKATTQATAMSSPFPARVVSLGNVGTGAVGTTVVIELL